MGSVFVTADLNPPLGYPGGPCQVIERVTDTVQNPRLREDLIQDVEDAEDFTNSEASKVYKARTEKGIQGTMFKGVMLSAHFQYRMDQRGINLSDVRQSLRDFHKDWANGKSQGSAQYREWQSDIEWGKPIRYDGSTLGPVLVFQPVSRRGQKGIGASLITTYFRNGPKVRRTDREDCEAFQGWSDMSVSPERVASRYREAGLSDIWLQWVVQPFDVIWKHHREFVQGPVDDAMDAIIKELAPVLVKAIVEEEVDADVDEFMEGATRGKWDADRDIFSDPDRSQTSDWQEGYQWGFSNPHRVKPGRLPPQVQRELVEEGLREVRKRITEEVVKRALQASWHAVSPVTTVKAIITAVKKHGWKLGVGFALFEIAEHFVIPAALSAMTGNPKYMALASLPIGEVVYAVIFRILGRTPSEADKADEDGHLDWYEERFGPVRIAKSIGDCYEANGSYFMNEAMFPGNDKSLRLVHGEVTGQGSLEGIKYGHCWVEDGNTVIDKSNGRNLKMPRAFYYALGRIGDNVHVYKPEEFSKKINQYGHWGPWDLRTSTGL